MTSSQDISDLIMRESSQELYSSVKIVLLYKLKKVCHPSSVASNDEVNVWENRKDLWNDSDEEVESFSVLQARDEDDVDLVWVSRLSQLVFTNAWVWSEPVGIDGVGDGEGFLRSHLCSQHEVVFASMTNTNGCIQVSKRPLNDFVKMNSS